MTTKLPYVRLTNLDRDHVISLAIKESFAKRDEDAALDEDALARWIYRDLFPEKVRKAAEAMPERWVKSSGVLAFNVGGMHLALNLTAVPDGRPKTLPVPVYGIENSMRIAATNAAEHVGAAQNLISKKEAIKADKKRAKESLKALVYSVRTLRALADLWPEGEPFYAWLAVREGALDPNLPAPQVAELNALLGLPKETSK